MVESDRSERYLSDEIIRVFNSKVMSYQSKVMRKKLPIIAENS